MTYGLLCFSLCVCERDGPPAVWMIYDYWLTPTTCIYGPYYSFSPSFHCYVNTAAAAKKVNMETCLAAHAPLYFRPGLRWLDTNPFLFTFHFFTVYISGLANRCDNNNVLFIRQSMGENFRQQKNKREPTDRQNEPLKVRSIIHGKYSDIVKRKMLLVKKKHNNNGLMGYFRDVWIIVKRFHKTHPKRGWSDEKITRTQNFLAALARRSRHIHVHGPLTNEFWLQSAVKADMWKP